MQHLIKAIETEKKAELNSFIDSVNKLTKAELINNWRYRDLIPKSKNVSDLSDEQIRAYIIKRKEKKVYKSIETECKEILEIAKAGDFTGAKIQVEWRKNRTWGANPFAECWLNNSGYFVSGSIGGCGYDKLSTAVANVLNQIPALKKLLYTYKNDWLASKPEINNRDLLGYGSGYGILPYIEGGVGVSCYPAIFAKIGFEFKHIASGKSFDVFTIEKI